MGSLIGYCMRRSRRLISPANLFGVAILLCWSTMIGLLHKRVSQRYILEISPKISEGEVRLREGWMGIYIDGEKVGYSFSSLQKEKERDGYLVRNEIRLYPSSFPFKLLKGNVFLDGSLNLLSFDFTLNTKGFRVGVNGVLEGRRLQLEIKTDGEKSQTIYLKAIPNLSSLVGLSFLERGLKVGRRYEIGLFDPFTLSTLSALIEVEGKEMIGEEEVYRVKQRRGGILSSFWVNGKGDVLRAETRLGDLDVLMVKESEEEALRFGE